MCVLSERYSTNNRAVQHTRTVMCIHIAIDKFIIKIDLNIKIIMHVYNYILCSKNINTHIQNSKPNQTDIAKHTQHVLCLDTVMCLLALSMKIVNS